MFTVFAPHLLQVEGPYESSLRALPYSPVVCMVAGGIGVSSLYKGTKTHKHMALGTCFVFFRSLHNQERRNLCSDANNQIPPPLL